MFSDKKPSYTGHELVPARIICGVLLRLLWAVVNVPVCGKHCRYLRKVQSGDAFASFTPWRSGGLSVSVLIFFGVGKMTEDDMHV